MTCAYTIRNDRGHVLLAALMVLIMLALLSMTLLYLAAQDAPGISAMREQTQALHLAEGAADLVLRWFHEPSAAPPTVAGLLMKREDAGEGPSFSMPQDAHNSWELLSGRTFSSIRPMKTTPGSSTAPQAVSPGHCRNSAV